MMRMVVTIVVLSTWTTTRAQLNACATNGVSCPTDTVAGDGYEGETSCVNLAKPAKGPLRGNVGCIDPLVLATRPTVNGRDANNIYGPMEAGFSSSVPGMSCLGSDVVVGGHDTKLAEQEVEYFCSDSTITVLDFCGGHANPYHYHEKMSCLYEDDAVSGHSTRVGTARDGNGIYGHHIDGGVVPCDLDACGGRTGVTPDSDGEEVYYYVITAWAPFTLGCYGKKDHFTTVEECRALYPECDSDAALETVTTMYGSDSYTPDCPCFDQHGSNVFGNSAIPAYYSDEEKAALPINSCASSPTPTPTPTPTPEPGNDEVTTESLLDEDDTTSSSESWISLTTIAVFVGGAVALVLSGLLVWVCTKRAASPVVHRGDHQGSEIPMTDHNAKFYSNA